MKNHEWVNGNLLQTNKKWSALKQSQRQWIQERIQEVHAEYVADHGKLPMKHRKQDVLGLVYEKIESRGIWIPYGEFLAHGSKAIDRLNRKSPLFIPPKPKKPKKPAPVLLPFEEFPAELQNEVKSALVARITHHISSTHTMPTNKLRDLLIKEALRQFNVRHYKKTMNEKMQSSLALIDYFDAQKALIFTNFEASGEMPRALGKDKLNVLRSRQVVIETDRLQLRRMSMKDLGDIKAMLADPDVMRAWERTYKTKAEVTPWLTRQLNRYEKELVGYFAAIDKASGQIVGQIGLIWNVIQGKRCLELGYILKKEHWHKGYATEGAQACLAFGFELFGISKIFAAIRPENVASIAVAERLGMTREGEFTKKFGEKRMPHLLFSISNPDKTT